MGQGRFYARAVTVAAATGGVPNYVHVEPAVGNGPVLFTGVVWRVSVTNFIPCFRGTEVADQHVVLGNATVPTFTEPIQLTGVDLRTIQVGSLGTAGGPITFTGTIV